MKEAIKAASRRAIYGLSERLLGRQRLSGAVPGRISARFDFLVPGRTGPLHLAGKRLPVVGWCIDFDTGEPLRWRMSLGAFSSDAMPVPRPDLATAFARSAPVPVRCGGIAELPLRPGPSLLRVEAEIAPGTWRILYRAFVIGLGAGRSNPTPGALWRYAEWRRERTRADGGTPSLKAKPVTILVEGDDPDAIASTKASLEAQTAATWTAVLVGGDEHPSFAQALAEATGDFILPLRAGDRLRPEALATLLAAAAADESGPDLVYADEEGPSDGASFPFFKPGWSPDRLEGFDYLGAPALYRASLARDLDATSAYDLALRFTEQPIQVVHVPAMLCARSLPVGLSPDADRERAALEGRLRRTGRSGQIKSLPTFSGVFVAAVHPPSPPPLVSIVIPTAGRELDLAGRCIDLAVDCVRGIRERSTYAAVEFVIVANTDLPPGKAAALRDLGCRIVMYEDPTFNVARKLNLGVAAAEGEYLLLLNDDIEIVAADWIERLLAQASKPHVGVVGAKLLYPDGTLQHGGVVLVDGNPLHARRFYPGQDGGYAFGLAVPSNVLAVTGACMMTRREIYQDVGGYTEAFAINFNDVDFCLKVRDRGLHVVLEPAAKLIHFESASRLTVVDPAEYALFQSRWRMRYPVDPFYDPAVFEFAQASPSSRSP